jgi:uncharacterized membrane protein YsdA (DUF1294 family)
MRSSVEMEAVARTSAQTRESDASAGAEAVLLTVALAFVAGAILAVASAGHFSEFWLFGVFFCVLAVAQLAWGAWLYARPSRTSLLAGVALDVPVIAIWLLSRTVGVPLGPDAWRPEHAGALDLAATLDECLIIVLVCLLAAGGARFELFRLVLRPIVYAVLIASGVALMMGGHHAS